MRWQLVKKFKVPVDHEMFNNANPAQLLWYAHMINNDRKEKFDENIGFVEYLASFINPEAVEKIKNNRESTISVDDKDFSSGLRKLFGREFTDDTVRDAHPMRENEYITNNNFDSNNIKNKKSISTDFIKKYLDMDLDTIRYRPKKK